MLNLTLKSIPAELHVQLKARAAANRRSLNREILALLEAQLAAPAGDVASEQERLERFVAALPQVDHTRVQRDRSSRRA